MNNISSLPDLKDKTILLRVDLNVPIDNVGNITDTTRLIETIPTIKYLQERNAKIILVSHFGRPKAIYDNDGNVIDGASHKSLTTSVKNINMFKNIVEIYKENAILVKKLNKCIGNTVLNEISNMSQKDVILLENVRYYKGETSNDPIFCENLANQIDIFVMDAFGTSHRKHASTYGVRNYIQTSAMGLLMEKEIKYLDLIMKSSNKKITAIIGGSKVSSKFDVLRSMMNRCNKIIIGGGMANTFLKANGFDVGKSLVEDNLIPDVKAFQEKAKEIGVRILLPSDIVVANEISENAYTHILNVGENCDDLMILDIGPNSIEYFKKHLQRSDIIVWNGPLGVFEIEPFSNGTKEIAFMLSELSNEKTVIAGGGDSIAAINEYNLANKYSHISTGGGAMLEYLDGNFLI